MTTTPPGSLLAARDFSAESAQEAIETAAALHGWDSLEVQFLHDFLMGTTPDE